MNGFRGLNLTSLACFVAVARAGGIAAGARRMDLATSAVSRRISELEEATGHILLDRSPAGVRLTFAGETVLRRAESILNLAELLRDDLNAQRDGVTGEVRLAAVAAAVSGDLPQALATFERENPSIHVMLSEGTNVEAARAVANGEADVGVVVDHHLPGGLVRAPFAEDPIWVIGPTGHPLFAKKRKAGVRFKDAVDYDIISLMGGASIESLVASAASALERPVRKHYEVSRYDSLRRLVEAGLGIGFLRQSAVTRYLSALDIEAAPLDEPWAARHLCVVHREATTPSRATQSMIEHLTAHAVRGR